VNENANAVVMCAFVSGLLSFLQFRYFNHIKSGLPTYLVTEIQIIFSNIDKSANSKPPRKFTRCEPEVSG
jgi:hypothetical protein